MSQTAALIVAGLVFGLVAIMHLLRLVLKWNVKIGGKDIAMWVSVIGFIITLSLCVWMFMASFSG